MNNTLRLFILVLAALGSSSTNLLLAQWNQTSGLEKGFARFVNCFALADTVVLAGTDSGVFHSTNSGTTWTAVGLANTYVRALAPSGMNLFAGTYGSGVLLTTDGGATWTALNAGLTNSYVRALTVSGTNLFAGTDSGVFLSTNKGTTWTAIGLTGIRVNAFAVSPASGGSGTSLFAGANQEGMFLSTNMGTTWTHINAGLGSNIWIRSLTISGTNLFAGTYGGGIYLSTNSGVSWTYLGVSSAVYAIVDSCPNLYVGASNGVFLSTNSGATWAAVGLANTDVRALAVSGANLLAGTYGAGAWQRPLSEIITSVNLPSGEVPKAFRLEQNYPNPFNPTTVISFQLAVRSLIKLRVYDILGREITTLLDGEVLAGSHSVTFDATRYSSGIYFYRLQAGEFVETKKMILLR